METKIKEKNEEYIFDKFELAKYINARYRRKFKGQNIPAIKMHKTLYFLFAYWGSYTKGMSMDTEEKNDFPIFLFNKPNFDARRYGPVEGEIYRKKDIYLKLPKEEEEKLIEDFSKKNNEINEFINGLIDDSFETSNFLLITRSHEDKIWNNAYREKKLKNKRISKMSSKKIIEEYLEKQINE